MKSHSFNCNNWHLLLLLSSSSSFFFRKKGGEGKHHSPMGQLSSWSRSDSSWQQQRAQNAVCAFSLERKGQAEWLVYLTACSLPPEPWSSSEHISLSHRGLDGSLYQGKVFTEAGNRQSGPPTHAFTTDLGFKKWGNFHSSVDLGLCRPRVTFFFAEHVSFCKLIWMDFYLHSSK